MAMVEVATGMVVMARAATAKEVAARAMAATERVVVAMGLAATGAARAVVAKEQGRVLRVWSRWVA